MKRKTVLAWTLTLALATLATVALAVDVPSAQPVTVGDAAAIVPGGLICHQFPGCFYVYNQTTGCCEEQTGGLCPIGRCL